MSEVFITYGNYLTNTVLYVATVLAVTTLYDFISRSFVFNGRSVSTTSPDFTIYASARMLLPLLVALVLIAPVGGVESVINYLRSWLWINHSVLKYFLITPAYTYLALVLYLVMVKYLGIGNFNDVVKLLSRDASLIKSITKLLVLSYVASLTVNTLLALGEELGWRAYLLPVASKVLTLPQAILLTGITWGVWHLPMYYFIKIEVGSRAYSLKQVTSSYLILCTLLSVPASIITLKVGSVLPAASLHGSLNAIWRLTEVVTDLSSRRKLLKASIASLMSWVASISVITYLIT